MATYSPTVRRRRLSSALRSLRQAAGLHADEVAKRLEWAPSKLTRMERNEWRLPGVRDVKDLLAIYGVPPGPEHDALVNLARQARQRGWWEEYRDVFLGGTLPEFEAEASQIRTYKSLLIPGLLQTADYARCVVQGGQVVAEDVLDRRVEARLTRQQVLEQEHPPILWAVIDEAALLKHVGGVDVMRAQLEHLIAMAARPNIGIQVVPNAIGAHSAMEASFSVLDFPAAEDPSLVYIELLTGDIYMELPDQVSQYSLVLDHVRASAMGTDASVEYMADLATQLH